MKKLTYEFVKDQIESVGYKLLSDVYIDAHGVISNKGIDVQNVMVV